jgi:hypothetical protein
MPQKRTLEVLASALGRILEHNKMKVEEDGEDGVLKSWITYSARLIKYGDGDSVICIRTRYGLEDSAFEPRWRHIYRSVQAGLEALLASCKICAGSLFRVSSGQGVPLTMRPPPFLLAMKSKK